MAIKVQYIRTSGNITNLGTNRPSTCAAAKETHQFVDDLKLKMNEAKINHAISPEPITYYYVFFRYRLDNATLQSQCTDAAMCVIAV